MKRVLAGAAIATLVSPMAIIAMSEASMATGCVTMTRTYSSGSSKYAVVKNNCGRTVDAQVVVNNFPDTNCASIGAYGTRTYRTGGILSPTASYARQC